VTRRVSFTCLAFVLFLTSSCGSSYSPASPAPPVPQLSGDWLGEVTVTSLDGGECLAPALQKDLVGFPGQFTGRVTQAGANLSVTLDIDQTGAICTYAGTINGNSITLDKTSCTRANVSAVSCPAGGARELVLQAEHLTATISGDRISGTFAETDIILVSGSDTSVGTLATSGPFILMRR
jgi:hypothetical protein